MPHIIVEHSANISFSSIKSLQQEIQNIMASITEGNFDADQCKARAFSSNEYLVGRSDQSTSSFIHITIKILTGRSAEVRKKLAAEVSKFSQTFFTELKLQTERCDISVDVVEMDRDIYQKRRFEQ